MTYFDSISVAAQHAHDCDLPADLLPLVINNEAHLLAGHDAGDWAGSPWD